jgi:hypothetical protein
MKREWTTPEIEKLVFSETESGVINAGIEGPLYKTGS